MLNADEIFSDRRDAGRHLADRLSGYASVSPFVMALSCGGVLVAFEVAKALRAPLDLLILRRCETPAHTAKRQVAKIGQSHETYLQGKQPIPVENRTVILIDDGVAMDSAAKAGLQVLRKAGAGQLVFAVPLGRESIRTLEPDANDLLCLAFPVPFRAGLHYTHFDETPEEEVNRLLHEAQAFGSAATPH